MRPITLLLLVIAANLHAASVTKKNNYMDNITFRDDDGVRLDAKPARLQDDLKNKFGEDGVHESCKHQTYCTIRPSDYPEEQFDEMFKDYKIPPMPKVNVLENRLGGDLEDDCQSKVTFEPLYVVREKRDTQWRIVVQSKKHNYVQQVRLETCLSVGESCFKPFLEDNQSYISSCHQLDQTWEVLVQKRDGNGTEVIPAKLPVCCSCKYKRIDFFTRFASDAAKESKLIKTKF